jgi:hypothetical protein
MHSRIVIDGTPIVMSAIRRIAVLIHEQDARARQMPYLFWAMCLHWKSAGIEIAVHQGPDHAIDADLVIPHLDMTVMPEAYMRALDHCPRVINRNARDISKRYISQQLVKPGSGYDGPVVIKTNHNFGGLPERRLAGLPKLDHLGEPGGVRGWWRRITGAATRQRDQALSRAQALDPERYPIFNCVRDVPPGVFENEALVVERFLPERDGKLYVLRMYSFFGNASVTVRITARQPIIKAHMAIDRQEVDPHPEVVSARQRLGFDYGKFDYVIHDGRVVLLDATRTPSLARGPMTERRQKLVKQLANGLCTWDPALAGKW